MAKGSRIARVLEFFRSGDADEARVTFTLVKEIMESRLKDKTTKLPVQRRRRRTRAEMEAVAASKVVEVPVGEPTAKASD